MQQQPATPADLRNAAALAVEQSSLRSVSREIGLSPTGLKKFLNGTNPYSPTLRRLRRWNEERMIGLPNLDPTLIAISLDLLFRDCDPDVAAVQKERAYACLELHHGVAIPRITPPPRAVQVTDCGCTRALAVPPSARPTPLSWSITRAAEPAAA